METEYKHVPGYADPLTLLKVGNMNRLIKLALNEWTRCYIGHCGDVYHNLIFNRFTGEIAHYPTYGYSRLTGWYRIAGDHYPVYYKNVYIGFVWDHEFNLCIPLESVTEEVISSIPEILRRLYNKPSVYIPPDVVTL